MLVLHVSITCCNYIITCTSITCCNLVSPSLLSCHLPAVYLEFVLVEAVAVVVVVVVVVSMLEKIYDHALLVKIITHSSAQRMSASS